MRGGFPLKSRPAGHGCSSGEDEVEGLALERSTRPRGIERKRSHAINKVFQIRGDAEVPHGSRDHKSVGILQELLHAAEIFLLIALGIIEIELEVFDAKIPDANFRHARFSVLFQPLYERISQRIAVARLVRACNKDENIHHRETILSLSVAPFDGKGIARKIELLLQHPRALTKNLLFTPFLRILFVAVHHRSEEHTSELQ